jgi:predicted regulator of Ras-like GTPase activity (Roadblock/LC7/MglB family)
MSFREILKRVVSEVDGALGAVLMGYDGISIDDYIREGLSDDIQLLAVEYTSIIKEVRRAVDVLKTGQMEELSLATDQSRIVIRIVNEDFFVLLALSYDGNFGKARYLLKRAVPLLRESL